MASATRTWTTAFTRRLAGARALRAHLGARWSVVSLLIPLAVFGAIRFGPRAGMVLLLSVFFCAGLGIAARALAGQSWRYLNAGSLVTGLLLGLTLSADTPLSLILLGAAVAEVAGKHRSQKLGTNPFNPAALGRAAVAVVELSTPAAAVDPDVVSSASPLYVAAGGTPAPKLLDMLAGTTPGAIGETSAALLAITGITLVTLVAVKREATLGMLGTIIVLVLVLPASSEIHGHAPWVLDPVVYLLGGPLFLYAFFFATDPATTPNTRLGGLIFGAGAGALGVLGRLYTTIPGPEMWAILVMNPLAPTLDRWLGTARSFAPAPGAAAEEGVRSFYGDGPPEESAPPRGLVVQGIESLVPPDEVAFGVLGRVMTGSRQEVVERVRESGLRGCGGARFPAARKWDAVLSQKKPRVLVVNGQEGEPDSFKDRVLMERRPELVIEGAAIAAHVIEASEIHVVHHPGDSSVRSALDEAISNLAEAHPELAERFVLVEGSGLYVCGEESALLAFLEGERGEPRERPPHPTESGLRGRPTLVHNVETLAWLPLLLSVRDARAPELPRLISVSGAVRCPGVYSASRDVSLSELVETAGGGRGDGASKLGLLAFAVGGPTGELLPASGDSTLVGELPGTGTLRVVSSSSCPVAEALNAARFAAKETCGRCTPCRVGSRELERMWSELAKGHAPEATLSAIEELSDTMTETSACGLGRDAPRRALSVLKSFPEVVTRHLEDEEHECDACRRSN